MKRESPPTHRLLECERAEAGGQDTEALLTALPPSTKYLLVSYDERLPVLKNFRLKVGITHIQGGQRQNISITRSDLHRIYLLG